MRPLALVPSVALLVLLAVGAAPLVAQEPAVPAAAATLPTITLPPALDRVLRDYERAWRARDAAALAALFAPDGFVLANGHPPARGRAAIQAAYADGGGPLVLRALHYAVDDTVGFIVGTFAPDESRPPQGKFVLALRRSTARGRWLIAADMDNTNHRPPRPQQAPPAGGTPPAGPR